MLSDLVSLFLQTLIGGVMLRVLDSSAIDRWGGPHLVQTDDY